MYLSFSAIKLVIRFEDGICILILDSQEQVALCPGHPDWNGLRVRIAQVNVVEANGYSNHSKGLYYLGVTERIVFDSRKCGSDNKKS